MNTTHDIVRRLGGPCELGRKLGIRSQAISGWVRRDRIPMDRVPTLLGLAREQGINLTAYELRPDIPWYTLK